VAVAALLALARVGQAASDAGVVDQQVELGMGLFDFAGQVADLVELREVGQEELDPIVAGLAADLLDPGLAALPIAPVDERGCPGAGELAGDASPEAVGGAGDEGGAVDDFRRGQRSLHRSKTAEEASMSKVIAGMTTSLDGFVTDASGSSSRLYPDLTDLRKTKYMQDLVEATGSVLMGRRAFDMADDPDWYVGNYELQVPIFVLTHRPPGRKRCR
jgi:hypothetical protein